MYLPDKPSFKVDKKYIKSTIEDFTQDKVFIQWVRNGINNSKWVAFIKEYPEKKKDIEISKKIIELLESKKSDIQEQDIYGVWKNVDLFYQLYHQRQRSKVFKRIARYAAIFMLALSIGTAIPYFYFKQKLTQFSGIHSQHAGTNEAKLILADGEEIALLKEESDLQFDETGEKINLNNDSIISQAIPKKPEKGAMNQVVTPFGKRANLQLSDGTKVWLNAGSKLIFPPKFNTKTRRVYLEGEAYFDVAENKENPFVVNTTELNITVLGTEFNLAAYSSDEEMAAVLVEGQISVKENNIFGIGGKEIILKPNQKAVYSKKNNAINVVSNVDLDYYTMWKDGLFLFKTESILNVFKRLSRYYNVEIITEKSLDVNNRISGKLDLKDSLEDVLNVVSEVAPISFTIDKNRVFVYDKLYYLPMKK